MVAWKQYLKSFASFFELSLAPISAFVIFLMFLMFLLSQMLYSDESTAKTQDVLYT